MQVSIIGGGVMGEAVLAGVLQGQYEPADVVVVEPRRERARELADRYSVQVELEPELAVGAQFILVLVKPQDIAPVLAQLGAQLRTVRPAEAAAPVVVSMAAGVSTASIEAHLGGSFAVVRVMPNTPALVGAGMLAVSAGRDCTSEQLAAVSKLLAPLGSVVQVPEEQQDAVTAVSGSGPAYVFLMMEAMIEAGVKLGLARDIATELVTQTVLGSAQLLRAGEEHPTLLRERVTSPGGTTAAAIAELEKHGLRAAFATAMTAARDRSIQLGKES